MVAPHVCTGQQHNSARALSSVCVSCCVSEGGPTNGCTPPPPTIGKVRRRAAPAAGQSHPRPHTDTAKHQHDASRARGHVCTKVGKNLEVAATDVLHSPVTECGVHRSTGCNLLSGRWQGLMFSAAGVASTSSSIASKLLQRGYQALVAGVLSYLFRCTCLFCLRLKTAFGDFG